MTSLLLILYGKKDGGPPPPCDYPPVSKEHSRWIQVHFCTVFVVSHGLLGKKNMFANLAKANELTKFNSKECTLDIWEIHGVQLKRTPNFPHLYLEIGDCKNVRKGLVN